MVSASVRSMAVVLFLPLFVARGCTSLFYIEVVRILSNYAIKLLSKRELVGTVKPVLSGHSKIDKTKILMINGSLMQVESIAECSLWRILQYF